ncbi:MAG TPA: lactate racemase domain-containing protein [Terracidiphilus sp.]
MSLYCAVGAVDVDLSASRLKELLSESLDKLGRRERVLAVPPDITRLHSQAGVLTCAAREILGERLKAVLPAIGTHTAVTTAQMNHMFPGIPHELFHVHNWRTDVETLGEIPAEFIKEVSEGKLNFAWPAQVNKMISRGGFDLILSIGQVVPHEVIGMANYNKNILIGTGGRMSINRSHYLGAVYGMERIMGRADNPVRAVLNRASELFLKDVPIVYVQTVVGRRDDGGLAVRGLFIGDDVECFHRAAELSLKVNFEMVEKPIRKAVVFLDPREFHSTWLGNKAVYRTRMALADGAELIILAPAVKRFGEDDRIDALIRKYGYHGTPATLKAVEENEDLAAELGAAAHLIHSSSEGRFRITWCPGELSREEIEGVGFAYGELDKMMERYNPDRLSHGWNCVDGEEVFFIANPGLGLWAHASRL